MAKAKGSATVEKKNQELERLVVEYVPATSVIPNEWNPNRQSAHDFALLIRSMMEDGFTQPIIVHKDDLKIVDGEHRWTGAIVVEAIKRLAKARGKQPAEILTDELVDQLRDDRLGTLQQHCPDLELPVVKTAMSPEQMRIATLRHNRARGSEDFQLAAEVLRDLQKLGALDWAQDSLQLDDVELNKLLEDLPAPDALAGEEFTSAWEPDKGHVEEKGYEASTEAIVHQSLSGTTSTSMTQAAVEASRKREREMAKAHTEEERAMVRKDLGGLYRVTVTFLGEEADIVKQVLGSTQAETLLALCRERLATQPPAEAEASVS
jgi:ParB-like chromosome segregation protein Spo0J